MEVLGCFRMPKRMFVLDNNVYYTFVRMSSYLNQFDICRTFLYNLLNQCENKVCLNESIEKEFDKFRKNIKTSKHYPSFVFWYQSMNTKHKFRPIMPNTSIHPNIHDDDVVYFQTADNTDDRIVVTCEENHYNKKEEIKDKFNINILSIEEANDLIINYQLEELKFQD